jgi:hypothetical protein
MRSPKSSLRLSLLLALVLPIASVLIARPGMTTQPVAIAQVQTTQNYKAEVDHLKPRDRNELVITMRVDP